MNASWKKFRTALRFVQLAKHAPDTSREEALELVSAQVAILEKRPVTRTDDELAAIDQVLKLVKFTADLPLRVRLDICKHCTHRKGRAGEVLYKQGEEGREFYIILQGVLACAEINTRTGQSSVVARLTTHQHFGDKDLAATNSRRQATVTCEKDCNLLAVSKADYDVISEHLQSNEAAKKITFLKKVPVFSHLPVTSLQVIATAMVARTCPKDSVIMRQGDDSTEVFFLVTGTCRTVRDVRFTAHESLQLSTLSLVKDAIDSASKGAVARKRAQDAPGTITGLPLAPNSGIEAILLPASLALPFVRQTDEGTTIIDPNSFEESRSSQIGIGTEAQVEGTKAESSTDTAETERPEASQSRVSFSLFESSPPREEATGGAAAGSKESPTSARQSSESKEMREQKGPRGRTSSWETYTSKNEQRSPSAESSGQSLEAEEGREVPGSESPGRSNRAPLVPFFPAGRNTSHGERIYPWESPRKKSPGRRTRSAKSPSWEDACVRAARARADVYSSKRLTVTQMLKAVPKRKEKARRIFLEVGQIHPPAYFGEVGILKNETRQASVVAATNVELYVLNKLDFQVRVGRDAVKQMEQRIAEFLPDETIRRLFLKNVLWSNYKAALVSEVTAHRNGNGKPTSAVPLPSFNFRQPKGQTVRLPRLLERRMTSDTPNLKLLKGTLLPVTP